MNQRKRLLLHVCCAPCVVYVYQKLIEHYDVTCFFFNPNIHPVREYQFRTNELERISQINGWNVVFADYPIKEWFQKIKGHEQDPERGDRCSICFYMRLEKTFQYAKNHHFSVVASTLSISPYKVTHQINEQGESLSHLFNIQFLGENFKKQNGFNIAKKMAQEMGIKHQNYCGCVFSKIEKKQKQQKKTPVKK